MSKHDHLYNTPRWRMIRRLHLRQFPVCIYCGRPASIADHVEQHRGDIEAFYNGPLQSLCKACHDSAKQREERLGHAIGCDALGNPLAGWKA